MDNSNKKEFMSVLQNVFILYNNEINKNITSIYFESLKHLSIEEVKIALNKHVIDPKQGMFMPKPAHIVMQVDSLKPSTEEENELAWLNIIDAMKRKGAYQSLDIEDKRAILAVKELGGWVNLCSKTEEQLIWVKKEFVKLYSLISKTKSYEELPEALPSIISISNDARLTKEDLQKQIEDLNKLKLPKLEMKL